MPETLRAYFNRLAPGWDSMAPKEPRLKEYLIRFGVAAGDCVLDTGAGTGLSTALVRECIGPSGFVVATDLAEGMLRRASGRVPGPAAAFVGSDAGMLPFKGGSFDKVLCYSAFPHFADQQTALAEMKRVLKPGGKALVLHASSHEKLNAFHASLEGPVRCDVLPSPESLRNLFIKTGFDVLRAEESDALYWVEALKKH
jgi:ubiquinone/menaquinone biosynthesis C-methylase UbiE